MIKRWLEQEIGDRPAVTTATATIHRAAWADRIRRAAGWLGSLGLRPGEVLALQTERSTAFLEVFLAATAMGAITLPLNDRYTADELRFMLGDAGVAHAVLVRPGIAHDLGIPAVAAAGVRQALDLAVPAALPDAVDPEAVAVICYTSGTTGRPKGARIRQRHLGATVEALHAAWAWTPTDVLVHALPQYHIHGLFVAACGALRAGAHLVWSEGFEARAVADAIAAHRATIYMGVPTHYHRLLALDPPPDFAGVRLFTSGSAPLPAHAHRAFEAQFGHCIVERYGMTEIGIVLSNPLAGLRKPGSVGLPLPGVRVRIVADDGQDAPVGAVGELWVQAPSVFEGYHGRPEATAAAFVDGWMRTGDHGHRDSDGYVHLAGRRSDLVLCGGFNVYPGEVERVLAEHPAVADVAVFGVTDPDLGEVPHAAVVARGALDVDALERWASERLTGYKRPRRIHRVDALPRNAMGKVLKRSLRRRYDPASEDA